ncbi:zinc transporter ZIP1-like [Glandiceps talaboti]
MSLDEIDAKIIALFGLFLISITCGLIPIFLAECGPTYRGAATERVFGFLNSFAGGVILATAMIHLLPSVRHEILLACDYFHINSNFPVAEFLACAGIFLMLILEQALLACKERLTKYCPEDIPLTSTDHNYYAADNNTRNHSPSNNIRTLETEEMESVQSQMRSYMFFVALCLHGVFEGIVIGLLDNPTDVFVLFAGIACHEGPVSFSFGVNIRRSWLRKTATIVLVSLHAFIFPIGIGIGLGIVVSSENTQTTNLASGLLQGFAIGMLMYITFFEILPYELNDNQHRLAKIVCILIGFTVVVLVRASTEQNRTEQNRTEQVSAADWSRIICSSLFLPVTCELIFYFWQNMVRLIMVPSLKVF